MVTNFKFYFNGGIKFLFPDSQQKKLKEEHPSASEYKTKPSPCCEDVLSSNRILAGKRGRGGRKIVTRQSN